MRRRDFLPALAGPVAYAQTTAPAPKKGRFKQGVTRGVFGRNMSLEDSCKAAAELGIKGYDLIGTADWPTLRKYGLVPSMYQGVAGSIASALNRKENHEKMEATLHAGIDLAAKENVPNIITSPAIAPGWRTRKAPTTAFCF